jgi:hypothetical protein
VDELAESYTESRYPGFDLDEPDWPALARLTDAVSAYMDQVRRQVGSLNGPLDESLA